MKRKDKKRTNNLNGNFITDVMLKQASSTAIQGDSKCIVVFFLPKRI